MQSLLDATQFFFFFKIVHDKVFGIHYKDCARQQIRYKTDLLDKKKICTAHDHLEDLQCKFILEY